MRVISYENLLSALTTYQVVDNILQAFLTYYYLVVNSDRHVIPLFHYYKLLEVITKLLCSPWLLLLPKELRRKSVVNIPFGVHLYWN